jgi:hypothetical protein
MGLRPTNYYSALSRIYKVICHLKSLKCFDLTNELKVIEGVEMVYSDVEMFPEKKSSRFVVGLLNVPCYVRLLQPQILLFHI